MRKNPLTVRGHLRRCWLFVYRTPEASARTLLPPPLKPVTFGGFAFWNIVVCEVTDMRPVPCPAWTGLAYWHVAYRLHVRARTADGRALEGLHFLRSDCDRPLVTFAGRILTDFNFHTARIAVVREGAQVSGRIETPSAAASFRLDEVAPPTLAPGSPFRDLDAAAAFLKYKPFGISVTPAGKLNVVRVSRDETAWRSRLVRVEEARWDFLAGHDVAPEICFAVEPIDYQWNRGDLLEAAP